MVSASVRSASEQAEAWPTAVVRPPVNLLSNGRTLIDQCRLARHGELDIPKRLIVNRPTACDRSTHASRGGAWRQPPSSVAIVRRPSRSWTSDGSAATDVTGTSGCAEQNRLVIRTS